MGCTASVNNTEKTPTINIAKDAPLFRKVESKTKSDIKSDDKILVSPPPIKKRKSTRYTFRGSTPAEYCQSPISPFQLKEKLNEGFITSLRVCAVKSQIDSSGFSARLEAFKSTTPSTGRTLASSTVLSARSDGLSSVKSKEITSSRFKYRADKKNADEEPINEAKTPASVLLTNRTLKANEATNRNTLNLPDLQKELASLQTKLKTVNQEITIISARSVKRNSGTMPTF